jgi:hypothetical protein
MAERMQNMSPEQRERMMARMRERGAAPGAPESAGSDSGRGRPGQPAEAQPATPTLAARNPQATTVDALFAPLPAIETRGQAWLHVDKQLKPVRLRLGITDGQATELIEGDVKEGDELVTNVTTGSEAARPTPGGFGGFPPFMGPGGRDGRGGGGNRGGGGRGR